MRSDDLPSLGDGAKTLPRNVQPSTCPFRSSASSITIKYKRTVISKGDRELPHQKVKSHCSVTFENCQESHFRIQDASITQELDSNSVYSKRFERGRKVRMRIRLDGIGLFVLPSTSTTILRPEGGMVQNAHTNINYPAFVSLHDLPIFEL